MFSSDLETLFAKQSPREILGFNFKKTVYLYNKLQFSDSMVRHYYTRKDTMMSFTQNAVCEHSLLIMQNMPYSLFSMQHRSFELSDSQTRVLRN